MIELPALFRVNWLSTNLFIYDWVTFPTIYQFLFLKWDHADSILNVTSFQCNRLTPSAHFCYSGHAHWDMTAVAPKNLTSDQYSETVELSFFIYPFVNSFFPLTAWRRDEDKKWNDVVQTGQQAGWLVLILQWKMVKFTRRSALVIVTAVANTMKSIK